MSHSFHARGMNMTTPHSTIKKTVRRKMDRLEWVPRVAVDWTLPRPPLPRSYLLRIHSLLSPAFWSRPGWI